MLPNVIAKVTKPDIERLVTSETAESVTLEYKEKLPGGSDEDKREFLADVSAMANSAGGDIVYGISEKRGPDQETTGEPAGVVGLSVPNRDAEQRRLSEVLQSGLDPPLPAVELKWVGEFAGGPALVVRVRKSWIAPHMVRFKGMMRFYGRNGSGKYLLDISQLRSAFLASENLADRLQNFRTDRLAKVIADQTPVTLNLRSRLIIHAVPIAALDFSTRLDVTEQASRCAKELRLEGNTQWDHRFNLDGFVTYGLVGTEPAPSYVQVFRRGAIEGVSTRFAAIEGDRGVIYAHDVESAAIEAVRTWLSLYEQWGLSGPVSVAISLVNVRGTQVGSRTLMITDSDSVERDDLLLPDVLVEDFGAPLPAVLRPAFDALWQSLNHPRSPNFDSSGNWTRRSG